MKQTLLIKKLRENTSDKKNLWKTKTNMENTYEKNADAKHFWETRLTKTLLNKKHF